MKTVIHVYKQDIKPENRPDTYNTYWGLGDCIRGSLTLFRLSKLLNFNLIVDVRHHPISSFLIDNNNPHRQFVDENIDNLKFYFYLNNLKNYLEDSFQNNDIVCVHTNAFINEEEIYYMKINPLTEEEKDFIKNIFKYNENCMNNFNLKSSIIPENFEIIHFRIGDNYCLNKTNLSPDDLIKFEDIFIKYYKEGDLFICDNQSLKYYLRCKYNIIVFDEPIAHIGVENNLAMIENTLFDFYIQSKSSKIKAYTTYEWISGFVQWNSKIYNIPLEKIQ
jgi:hypothetical protein